MRVHPWGVKTTTTQEVQLAQATNLMDHRVVEERNLAAGACAQVLQVEASREAEEERLLAAASFLEGNQVAGEIQVEEG